MKVLIVDDIEINRKLLRVTLEAEGIQTFEAKDGIEALEALGREKADVVIADILMPRMDGYRLCQEVRKDALLRETAFIVYTSTYTSPGDEKLAMDCGADYYLKKPAPAEEILKAIGAGTESSQPRIRHAAPPHEPLVMREYNEALVRKLEERNTALDEARQAISKAHEILRESEERYRQLFQLSPDAIAVQDYHTGALLLWNPSAEQLYGWTAAEAAGHRFNDLVFQNSEDVEKISNHLQANEVWRGEVWHVKRDRGALIVHLRATLIRDAAGQPTAVLMIVTDVTEQKKLMEQLLRAQRLECVGALASGLAHDLNNVLAPILMSIPALKPPLAGTPFEPMLSTIGECAERGANIVKQVLAFARGVGGEHAPVQVRHLLRDVEAIARQTFPRSITVRNTVPNDLWPVLGDFTQLHQVLLNLCVNARDAMPNGGVLRIESQNLQIDENYAAMSLEAKPGSYLSIAVSDTGDGIPPENFQKIFDPFFTTKGVGEGSGLGLSTSIGIVRSHRGFLTVESEVGMGSTFRVFLPVNPETFDPPASEPETKAPGGNGELILFADDEPSVRSIAQVVLQAHSYRVLLAADGTEALAAFAQRSSEIDVVVTDIAMPFMDGVSLIRALRRMKPDLRFIVSTGRPEKAQVAELRAATLLTKPYDSEALLRAIHAALTAKPNSR